MEKNKGYIIYLKNYENSVEWAQQALASGRALGWNLELYEGVDGKTTTAEKNNIKFFQGSKKSNRLMQRPGTLGCFLSQYNLWQKCFKENTPICIFEHDVVFKKPFSIDKEFEDVLKFEGFMPAKPMRVGQWWEGARAYCLKPQGAKKILDFVKNQGAMPADWCLNSGILNVEFDQGNKVVFDRKDFSFTKDLQ